MSLPIVAVIGRPNVGKSTFINRVATERATITHQMPGVTRDRKYVEVEWFGKNFLLIDTGGFQFEKNQKMSSKVLSQAKVAIEEAEAVIFIADGKEGLNPCDEEIASLLRKSGKKTYFAVNKIDIEAKKAQIAEFYELGFDKVYAMSAVHGLGVSELIDDVVETLPKVKPQIDERFAVAIVGRPNVGKSSLLNKLLGQERAIVSEVPGTTRDVIDSIVAYKGREWRFIDTAGIKKKRVKDIEYYGLVRTLEALDRADVALIMIEAAESVSAQDQRIADYAVSRGCAVIILLNKWDLIDEEKEKRLQKDIERKLGFVSFAPILDISVKTGRKISKIFGQLEVVEDGYTKQIKTSKLNRFIRELDIGRFPSKYKIRIGYANQLAAKPPKFLFFINPIKAASPTLKRFLEGQLRDSFGFIGTPVKILFKGKKKADTER